MINVTKLSHNSIIKKLYIGFTYLCAPIPDAAYLKMMYRVRTGEKLHLEDPKTFNEKMQWLKINDRRPIYTTMVDKYAVKKYVSDIIGEEYIIPTLGVWDKFDDIDFGMLPEQFVLKCTHDSGGLIIVRDKSKMDVKAVRKKMNACIRRNYFLNGREWPYKNVPHRILAEKYMETNGKNTDLRDYKLMSFNGKVMCSFVVTDRNSKDGLKVTFFDKDWSRMPFERHYPVDTREISKPKHYNEMIEIAEKLSSGYPFMRVDFYDLPEQLYFGEITLFPGNGLEEFRPVEYDRILGDWLNLEYGR